MQYQQFTDKYGFENYQLTSQTGGSIHIVYHGGVEDVAFITSDNGRGLASSDYARKAADFDRHIANVIRTVWLSEAEKDILLEVLNNLKKKANDFLDVRNRFNISAGYQAGHSYYIFTEKPDNPITLHTKVSITIDTPAGWTESNAWRALEDVLNPKSIPASERFNLKPEKVKEGQ